MAIEHDTLLRILLAERARVLAFIHSLVRQRETAEDVFQDVCILALEKREQIADDQHLAAWLRTTARLQAMNVLRKKQNRQKSLDNSVLELMKPHWSAHDDTSCSAMGEALRECVQSLTEKSRQLVQRRYADDLTVTEIAQRSNRPANTVYVALRRIHDTLADCVFQKVAAKERGDRA